MKSTETAGLPEADRLLLEMTLRQIGELRAEILRLEQEIIRLGQGLPGLERLLQVRGLNLLTAIGLLPRDR